MTDWVDAQTMTVEERIRLAYENTLTHLCGADGVSHFTYREGSEKGTIIPDSLGMDAVDVDIACRHIQMITWAGSMLGWSPDHRSAQKRLLEWFERLTDQGDQMLYANDQFDPHEVLHHTFSTQVRPIGRCISLHAERETLLALLALMRDDQNRGMAIRRFRAHVQFWREHFTRDGEGLCTPAIFFIAGGGFAGHWLYPHSDEFQLFSMGPGRLIMPLVRFFDTTGDEASLDLAYRIAYYLVHQSGDYLFSGNEFRSFGVGAYHNHSTIMSIAGALLSASRKGDKELFQKAKSVFDHGIVPQCSEFGWTPEMLHNALGGRQHKLLDPINALNGCETCCVANMIETAIVLAQEGHTDYWALAERFAKNHLFASQMTNGDWVKDPDERAMVLGSFSGRSAPNAFFVDNNVNRSTMSCCHAEGTRALCLLYDNTVTEGRSGLSVNLHFTRDHPALKVDYALEGNTSLLGLKHLGKKRMRIQMPEDVDPDQITISDSKGDIRITEDYIQVDEPGREVKIEWPMLSRTTMWTQTNSSRSFTISWKGNVVDEIKPDGGRFALYRRETNGVWGS